MSEKEVTKRKRRRKKRKIVLPIMALMAVLSVVGAVFGIYYILEESGNPLLSNQPDVQLPSFVGLTEAEINNIEDFEFEAEYLYNSEYEEGVVFAQKPTAPRFVKKHSTVKVKISKGRMSGEMPDLKYATRAGAQKILSEMGVNIYFENEEIDKEAEDYEIALGNVIRTEPEAGEIIQSGDMVKVYIASENMEQNRGVPHVVGLTNIEDAKKEIIKKGLVPEVVLVVSDQPAGTIIWQQPEPGVVLLAGEKVQIYVSQGQ